MLYAGPTLEWDHLYGQNKHQRTRNVYRGGKETPEKQRQQRRVPGGKKQSNAFQQRKPNAYANDNFLRFPFL